MDAERHLPPHAIAPVPPVLDDRVGRRFQPRVETTDPGPTSPFAGVQRHCRCSIERHGCSLTSVGATADAADGSRRATGGSAPAPLWRCGRSWRRQGRRCGGRRPLWHWCRLWHADSRRWCWRYLHRRRSSRRRRGFRLAGRRRWSAVARKIAADNRGDYHECRDRQRRGADERGRSRRPRPALRSRGRSGSPGAFFEIGHDDSSFCARRARFRCRADLREGLSRR